jgi:hypothetical protein
MLLAWGCGGQVAESPGATSGEPVQVSAQFTIGGAGLAASASKDASGSGGLTGEGEVDPISDAMVVSCEWTGIPDTLYDGGCPIIKGEDVTYADDCIGADLGAFDSNCCLVARMSTDPVTGKCDLAIEGVVPGNNPTIAAISLYPVGHINVSISSYGATDATSMALLQHADLVGTNNLSFPQDVVDLQNAMDVSGCDGGGDMAIDFADAMGLYDTFLGDSFDKAFGFTDYGDGSCDFDQMYDFELSLADTLNNNDIYVEPFDLTVRFTLCDEKAGGLCVLAGAGGEGDMVATLMEGALFDGATDIMANAIDVVFDQAMNSATINSSTIELNAISNTEKKVEYTIIEASENTDYLISVNNTAQMAQEELQLVLKDSILNLNNEYYAGATLNFTTSWAVGDVMDKDSHTAYAFDKVVATPGTSVRASTYAAVSDYLNFAAMNFENQGLVVTNTNQPDDTGIMIFASKELIQPDVLNLTPASGEIYISEINGGWTLDNGNGDRDLLGLAVSNPVTGDLVFVGLAGGFDEETGLIPTAKDIMFFFDGVAGDITHCRDRDNPGSSLKVRLDYDPSGEVATAYVMASGDLDWIDVSDPFENFTDCTGIELNYLPFGVLDTSRDAGLLVHFASRDILDVGNNYAIVTEGYSTGMKSADELLLPLMWEPYPVRKVIGIPELPAK